MAGFGIETGEITAGFTGTQAGMTPAQRWVCRDLLLELNPLYGRHGDCIGADADFHEICLGLGVLILLHPPSDPRKRAWCSGYERSCLPRPYLDRNDDIARYCTFLIATPKESEEQLRSGTWSTIRRARKYGRPVYLILPDGAIEV